MEAIYTLLTNGARSGWLPSFFEHAFMVRALIAALLIAPLLGAVGTLVLTKRLVFFTQTIGHAALTGVAIGLLFGEPMHATYGGLYGFCLIVAAAMLFLRHRSQAASDTVVGVVLSIVLGIGIVMLVVVTKQFNVHQVEAILFGSLITITEGDLALLAGTALVTAFILGVVYNRIMLAGFNPAMSRMHGDDPIVLDYIFVIALTILVVSSLKLIGALLVLALIVIPAATAQNLATHIRGFFWLSVVIATLSAVFGLTLSGAYPIPSGGAIVLIASGFFVLSLLIKSVVQGTSVRQGSL